MKVYDFAKHLGLETMDLMKKVRDWNLPVKSHMVDLDDKLMEEIRKRLRDDGQKGLETKKKTVRRKTKKTTTRKTTTKTKKEASGLKRKVIRKRKSEIKKIVSPTKPPSPQTFSKTDFTPKPKAPKSSENISVEKKESSERSRNIRTGFLSVKGFEDFYQEESKEESKEKEAERTKKKVGKNLTQKEFSASDFRKREVVFQPKKKVIALGSSKKTLITTPKSHKRIIKVHEDISVNDLAGQMKMKVPQVIKKLISQGVKATPSTALDFDTVLLFAEEMGFEAKNLQKSDKDLLKEYAFGNLEAPPKPRAPVVTIMGHVDHGKTTLLDAIRETNVVSGEVGGITQRIGAYQVALPNKKSVTFIDTPGHEAFTQMRQRGANVTDIVIIVVAADDGMMPQTEEAISHAQAAKVPILVAVNKTDVQGAQPEKIRQQLSEKNLVPEDWGGETIFVEVSALKKKGIKELLEQVLLLSEMLELKAVQDRSAIGVVIESRMEKGKGNVSTVLIKEGSLKKGDFFVSGTTYGQVRNLFDDRGKMVKEATPGDPVEVSGFSESVDAGNDFYVCKKESQARSVAEKRKLDKEKKKAVKKSVSLEDLLSEEGEEVKSISVVLKSDEGGVLQALEGELLKIDDEEVKVKILHKAVGEITESDVLLASTTSGRVIGFNVRPTSKARSLAKEKNIPIKTYNVIYELVEDLDKMRKGMLKPEIVEEVEGRAQVREVFQVSKAGTIAGCKVLEGKIKRAHFVRLLRDGRVVYESKISSLKRFKEDVKEVGLGFECGLAIENYNDIKANDEIEAFSRIEKRPT